MQRKGKHLDFPIRILRSRRIVEYIYQYPEKDQVGADISKEIQNKIQVTQQKEG